MEGLALQRRQVLAGLIAIEIISLTVSLMYDHVSLTVSIHTKCGYHGQDRRHA